MTHPLFPAFTATQPQRHRRLLLTLPAACALPVLSACGGGGGGGGADLSYDTEQALYVVGEAITPNKPQLTTNNPKTAGHTAPTFSVWPALPAGLALNTQTGVISGTPTQLRRQANHTVIARNNRGFAETQLRITVTGRGAWSSVATIPGPREHACISRLPDGKVLVAGGAGAEGWTDTAHVYDPVTSHWTPAASMLLMRGNPMCIALRDGRVLVFGGAFDAVEFAQAELYDPVANTWTATGGMVAPRRYASACLLADGKVMVAGGVRLGMPIDTVELYDPATGVWAALPHPLSHARYDLATVLLPDGKKVLVVGGTGVSGPVTAAELYTLDGSAPTSIPSGSAGGATQAVQLDDGSVLIVNNTVSSRFYPRTSTWSTSPVISARLSSQTVLLADGRVLRASGFPDLNTAEIYNPDVNVWTTAAPMAAARFAARAVLLNNGRVLMVGGRSTGLVDSTELYTP